MEFNPYRSPELIDPTSTQLDDEPEKIYAVAFYQKAINACVLAQLASILAQFAIVITFPELAILWLMGWVVITLASLIFAFMLAMALHGIGQAIVYGVLMIIPYLNLILLLFLNSRATRLLRRYRIRVGLLGANLKQLREAIDRGLLNEPTIVPLDPGEVAAIRWWKTGLTWCFIAWLLLIAGIVAAATLLPSEEYVEMVIGVAIALWFVLYVLFSFGLAIRTRGTVVGVLLGVLAAIPIIGFVVGLYILSLAGNILADQLTV